jgi:hypothetical protein
MSAWYVCTKLAWIGVVYMSCLSRADQQAIRSMRAWCRTKTGISRSVVPWEGGEFALSISSVASKTRSTEDLFLILRGVSYALVKTVNIFCNSARFEKEETIVRGQTTSIHSKILNISVRRIRNERCMFSYVFLCVRTN